MKSPTTQDVLRPIYLDSIIGCVEKLLLEASSNIVIVMIVLWCTDTCTCVHVCIKSIWLTHGPRETHPLHLKRGSHSINWFLQCWHHHCSRVRFSTTEEALSIWEIPVKHESTLYCVMWWQTWYPRSSPAVYYCECKLGRPGNEAMWKMYGN